MSSTDSLVIGTDPGDLTVKVTKGRAWSNTTVLYELDAQQNEQVISWDAPPHLEFDGGLVIVSVLSDDVETSTPNAVASWSMTGLETADLETGQEVFLTVNGEDWFKGEVKCLS